MAPTADAAVAKHATDFFAFPSRYVARMKRLIRRMSLTAHRAAKAARSHVTCTKSRSGENKIDLRNEWDSDGLPALQGGTALRKQYVTE